MRYNDDYEFLYLVKQASGCWSFLDNTEFQVEISQYFGVFRQLIFWGVFLSSDKNTLTCLVIYMYHKNIIKLFPGNVLKLANTHFITLSCTPFITQSPRVRPYMYSLTRAIFFVVLSIEMLTQLKINNPDMTFDESLSDRQVSTVYSSGGRVKCGLYLSLIRSTLRAAGASATGVALQFSTIIFVVLPISVAVNKT